MKNYLLLLYLLCFDFLLFIIYSSASTLRFFLLNQLTSEIIACLILFSLYSIYNQKKITLSSKALWFGNSISVGKIKRLVSSVQESTSSHVIVNSYLPTIEPGKHYLSSILYCCVVWLTAFLIHNVRLCLFEVALFYEVHHIVTTASFPTCLSISLHYILSVIQLFVYKGTHFLFELTTL